MPSKTSNGDLSSFLSFGMHLKQLCGTYLLLRRKTGHWRLVLLDRLFNFQRLQHCRNWMPSSHLPTQSKRPRRVPRFVFELLNCQWFKFHNPHSPRSSGMKKGFCALYLSSKRIELCFGMPSAVLCHMYHSVFLKRVVPCVIRPVS